MEEKQMRVEVEEFQCLNVNVEGQQFMFKFDPKNASMASVSIDGGATWVEAAKVSLAINAFNERHPFAME